MTRRVCKAHIQEGSGREERKVLPHRKEGGVGEGRGGGGGGGEKDVEGPAGSS